MSYFDNMTIEELINTLKQRDELIKHLSNEVDSRGMSYNVLKKTSDFFIKKYEEEIEDLRRQLEEKN